MYDNLSPEQKEKQSYTAWVKDAYSNQYEKWMPWIEDKYLAWFGNDNKASYVTKGTLGLPSKFAWNSVDVCYRYTRQDEGHRH